MHAQCYASIRSRAQSNCCVVLRCISCVIEQGLCYSVPHVTVQGVVQCGGWAIGHVVLPAKYYVLCHVALVLGHARIVPRKMCLPMRNAMLWPLPKGTAESIAESMRLRKGANMRFAGSESDPSHAMSYHKPRIGVILSIAFALLSSAGTTKRPLSQALCCFT